MFLINIIKILLLIYLSFPIGLGLFLNDDIKSDGSVIKPTPPKIENKNQPTNEMIAIIYINTETFTLFSTILLI